MISPMMDGASMTVGAGSKEVSVADMAMGSGSCHRKLYHFGSIETESSIDDLKPVFYIEHLIGTASALRRPVTSGR